MDFYFSQLTSLLPAQIDFVSMLKFILLFAAGSLLLSLLGRAVFGKRSGLNHAVSSAMGILFIYVVTIVVYTFNPSDLSRFLSPLPFVQFSGEYLCILPFHGTELSVICEHVLSLLILAFLVNLLDSLFPKGKTLIGWYGLRFVTVILAIGLHYVVNILVQAFLPGVLVTYAPIILLGILVVMVLLGVASGLLGLVLVVANPILGAIYAFFFSNIIGKQISKALVTTGLICAVVYALEYFGYSVICISAAALSGYLPLLAVLLVLWYLIGHLL